MSVKKTWIGALIVVAALGYLAVTGVNQEMVPYVSIAEVKAATVESGVRGVRVKGRVIDGTIEVAGPREVWFEMEEHEFHGGEETLRAHYTGVLPDTFKDGAEVVLAGKVDAAGHFEAHELLAKCPSKYEAETPESAKDY
jgi:cytochrome c-type biogenesis protein CcmE